jgi:hypothetical protein
VCVCVYVCVSVCVCVCVCEEYVYVPVVDFCRRSNASIYLIRKNVSQSIITFP